jgi:hypothetical protein
MCNNPEKTCDYITECEQMAIEIRDIIFDDASDIMQGAMTAEPGECFGFALEWIKKQKNLPYNTRLFKGEFNNGCK